MVVLRLLYSFILVGQVIGFTVSPAITHHQQVVGAQVMPSLRTVSKRATPLYAENETKKKAGIDEKVRTKLLSESIAPWRSLRLFLYGSLGTGALVGGLITLSGTAAVLSGAKEGDMNTEVGLLRF